MFGIALRESSLLDECDHVTEAIEGRLFSGCSRGFLLAHSEMASEHLHLADRNRRKHHARVMQGKGPRAVVRLCRRLPWVPSL